MHRCRGCCVQFTPYSSPRIAIMEQCRLFVVDVYIISEGHQTTSHLVFKRNPKEREILPLRQVSEISPLCVTFVARTNVTYTYVYVYIYAPSDDHYMVYLSTACLRNLRSIRIMLHHRTSIPVLSNAVSLPCPLAGVRTKKNNLCSLAAVCCRSGWPFGQWQTP